MLLSQARFSDVSFWGVILVGSGRPVETEALIARPGTLTALSDHTMAAHFDSAARL